MHYYKSNNEIMQYCIVSNDIALIMHYRALLKRSGTYNTTNLLRIGIFLKGYFLCDNSYYTLRTSKCIQFYGLIFMQSSTKHQY